MAAVYENWDWLPYAETFLKVKPMTGPVVPFRANLMQRFLRKWRVEGRRRVIRLKMRRGGSTLAEIIAAVVYSLCVPYFNTVVVSDDRQSAEKIVNQHLKPIIDNLPPIIRDRVEVQLVQRELRITHMRGDGSKLGESIMYVGGLRDDSFGLGYDIHYAIKTEAAYAPARGKEIWSDLVQAVPAGYFETEESTARGVGNEFHTDYVKHRQARQHMAQFFPWPIRETAVLPGDSPDCPAGLEAAFPLTEHEMELATRMKRDWGIHMTHDHFRFYRWRQIEDGNLVRQYYPENDVEAFLSTSIIQFPAEILEGMYNAAPDPLDSLPDEWREKFAECGWAPRVPFEANGLRLWRLPEPGCPYTIGVDTGKGEVSSNRSVAQIMSDRTGEQDGILRGVYRPDEFADKVNRLGHLFGDAFIVPEANGIGGPICNALEDRFKYPPTRLFRHDPLKSCGYDMTRARKNELFGKCSAGIASYNLKLNDRVTISEMLTYRVDKHGRLGAPEGAYDDCTMAWMLACTNRTDGRTTLGLPRRRTEAYGSV